VSTASIETAANSSLVNEPLSRSVSDPAADPQPWFYHPELDGLRFFAFFAVFLHHAFPISAGPATSGIVLWMCSLFQAGEAGVDLFFALSAFLITQLLLRERERTGRIHVGAFYVRRALRIWPLYFAFLAFAVFCESAWIGNAGLAWPYSAAFAVFLGNWAIAITQALPASSALILWTVSIEEQFYLLWPLVVSRISRTGLAWFACGMWGIGILSRIVLESQGANSISIGANALARLDAFAVGILLACWFQKGIAPFTSTSRKTLMALGGLGLLATTRFFHVAPIVSHPAAWEFALRAVCVGLVLSAVLQPLGLARGLFSSPGMVFLGRISYGLYVFHLLAILVAGKVIGTEPGFPWRRAGLALAFTLLAASVSYFALEKPFLKWKLKFTYITSRPGG
jgi:peptidoglycan/LPS O-acetylase OafA/YrhL